MIRPGKGLGTCAPPAFPRILVPRLFPRLPFPVQFRVDLPAAASRYRVVGPLCALGLGSVGAKK